MVNFYLLVIILALITFFYAWYQIFLWRKKIRKEVEEAEEAVNLAFDNLRQKIEKEIEFLDKEPGLNKEEKEIRDRLQEVLESSGQMIRKEIKDIKKSID